MPAERRKRRDIVGKPSEAMAGAGGYRSRLMDAVAAVPECAGTGGHLPPSLLRPFRVIVLNWESTADAGGAEGTTPIRALAERLLQLGVYVVVITGAGFPNVNRQLASAIRGPYKQRLFVSADRGSEVYGFDAQSHPTLVWRFNATPDEDRLVAEVTGTVRDELVRRTGLSIAVIHDRPDRRKLDLIPLPEWSNPPRSAIGQLFEAVQARLQGAGLAGGLQEVVDLTARVARAKGLTEARITCDVKHVEVGLTDKADAVDWLMRELARPRGVAPHDILVVGDEFGPVAGLEGSDHKMVTAKARGATFVSVGPELDGVPPGVIHLGGGPPCLRALLARQVALRERQVREARAGTEGAGPGRGPEGGSRSHPPGY